ncbi:hypothetical protein ANN_23643 [Periplaneta americana]|uniref:Uncharacterized protein n=1 Tax=Periplaneta americana TaxID=6978 RepID=A0ABQ8SLN3_PERAM|nr:hypothetical protein ANN_23643 [Periplaneta americana]
MAGLCEGGKEPPGSLKANVDCASDGENSDELVNPADTDTLPSTSFGLAPMENRLWAVAELGPRDYVVILVDGSAMHVDSPSGSW